MDTYKRIISILTLFKQEEIKNIGKRKATSFSRNRNFTEEDYIYSILLKKGKTLTLEIRDYMSQRSKKIVTKQAYSKQRQNLNPYVFEAVNDEYIKKIYEETKVERYKEYLLLAVDGTTNELPNSPELKSHYGISLGQKGSVGRVRARAIGIYDSLNKIMIKARIDKYNVSEKELIEKELDNIKKVMGEEKYVLIFDRYYFGVSFVHLLNKKGIKYVIRMRNNHYQKEKKQMKTNDEEVTIKIRTNSVFYAESKEEKEELKRIKEVKTRIIKLELDSGEEEHLATNLTEEELPTREAKDLYFKRWEIEKAFDVLKNKIQMENYSSKKVIGVEQEFYASILLFNMIEDMAKEIDRKVEPQGNKKYKYKVNKNILVGIYKQELIKILEIEDEKEQLERYKKMIDEIKNHLVPIKPGRKFNRRRMHSMNKYRSNLRRNI